MCSNVHTVNKRKKNKILWQNSLFKKRNPLIFFKPFFLFWVTADLLLIDILFITFNETFTLLQKTWKIIKLCLKVEVSIHYIWN